MAAEDATSVGAILPWADGWHVVVNGKHHSRLPFGGVHTRLGAIPALVHPVARWTSPSSAWDRATPPGPRCAGSETRSLTVFEIAGPQRAPADAASRSATSLPRAAEPARATRASPCALDDGRHALARGAERYDLIEADALWPYAAYSGNLYSVEFFRECAGRLKPGGLMCTWAPTPRVVASFRAAFPHVAGPGTRAFLLGSNEPIPIEPDGVAGEARVSPGWRPASGRSGREDILHALERIRILEGGPEEGVDLNHDLYPRDEFLAP